MQKQREDEEAEQQNRREREASETRKSQERMRRIEASLGDKVTKCPNCSQRKLIKLLRVIDKDEGTYDLSILVQEAPAAVLFKEHVRHSLKASACGNCGYTELYVESPAALWQSFTKSVENAPS